MVTDTIPPPLPGTCLTPIEIEEMDDLRKILDNLSNRTLNTTYSGWTTSIPKKDPEEIRWFRERDRQLGRKARGADRYKENE